MKLTFLSSLARNRRGEIGTIAILVGMAIVGLGIAAGTWLQNPENRVNLLPRAAAAPDPLWSNVKPGPNNLYPWTNGGPTTGWESYLGQRVYMCNGEYCWIIERSNNQTSIGNGGNPIRLSQDPAYNTVKGVGDRLPWSGNGPTAAWTWDISYNGQSVNETLLCNGSFCWRYIRYPNGTGEWRDGGNPINLATLAFWKDKPHLYSNNGPTVGWTDPINKKATLCNGGSCESLSYSNWQWLGAVSPYPPNKGVSRYTSAWTSPVTNIQTLCTANSCWNFTLRSGGGSWASDSILITPPAATNTPKPPTPTVRSCSAGQLLCANNCTNVTNNNQHCGACGRACAQGQTCSNSVCVAQATPTPYINLSAKNPQGTPVPVRGMSYTYNCGSYPSCFTTPKENTSSYTVYSIGTWQGGGGIVLNSNQRLLGVTPQPGGGSLNTKTNNNSNTWFNSSTWNNYWWPRYPQTGSYSLNFVVATITPTANPLTNCAPRQSSPINGATVTGIPTLSWSSCAGVSNYQIEVTGGGIAWTSLNLSGTSYTMNGFTFNLGNTYSWRVRGCISSTCTAWSPAQTFKSPPKQVGNIKITIPGTQNAGMQWRRTGTTTWINDDATESGVATGTYTIEFKPLTGYNTPANLTGVVVQNGQTVSRTSGEYTRQAGSLRVSISNAPSGAMWRRTNTAGGWDAWRNNNFTDPAVPTGTYNIEFIDVTGYTKPTTITGVVVNANTLTTRTATYVAVPSNTPTTTVACIGISQVGTSNPTLNDKRNIICNQSSQFTKYEFRYKVNNGQYQNLAQYNDQPVGVQGWSKDLVFNQAGTYTVQCRPCIGNNCAAWTNTCTKTYTVAGPTSTPTSTPIPSIDTCPRRAAGDANCDGKVDYVDFICWRGELNGAKPANCISSNFIDPINGTKNVVDGADYSVWFTTFRRENQL